MDLSDAQSVCIHPESTQCQSWTEFGSWIIIRYKPLISLTTQINVPFYGVAASDKRIRPRLMTPQPASLNNAYHQFVLVNRVQLLVIMVIVGTPGYVPSASIDDDSTHGEAQTSKTDTETGWSGGCLA